VAEVGEDLAAALQTEFPQLSPRALRNALRSSGLPLAPCVEGVRQHSLAELERTLAALAAKYGPAGPARRRLIRRMVFESRLHAEWAARNPKLSRDRRQEKQEMTLWLKTWLENPPLFCAWLELRKMRRGQPDPFN
jgi:hypothetical protein